MRTEVLVATGIGARLAAFSNFGAQPDVSPGAQQSIAGLEKIATWSPAGRAQQKRGSARSPAARTRSVTAKLVLFMLFPAPIRAACRLRCKEIILLGPRGWALRHAQAAIRISLAISACPRRHVTAAASASRRPAAPIVNDPMAGKDEIRSPSIVSCPEEWGHEKRDTAGRRGREVTTVEVESSGKAPHRETHEVGEQGGEVDERHSRPDRRAAHQQQDEAAHDERHPPGVGRTIGPESDGVRRSADRFDPADVYGEPEVRGERRRSCRDSPERQEVASHHQQRRRQQ